MAGSLNKVLIIGNVGQDPELKSVPNGSSVCTLSVASSRKWVSKTTQEKVEETEWHRVVFFDKLADIVGQYVTKGMSIYVEGRLKTRKWEKNGQDMYTTEVVAEQMQMLGSKDKSESSHVAQPVRNAYAEAKGKAAPQQKTGTGFDDMDSDIPFN